MRLKNIGMASEKLYRNTLNFGNAERWKCSLCKKKKKKKRKEKKNQRFSDNVYCVSLHDYLLLPQSKLSPG